jgi:hypothetical protein
MVPRIPQKLGAVRSLDWRVEDVLGNVVEDLDVAFG